jgi:hypothetical protein
MGASEGRRVRPEHGPGATRVGARPTPRALAGALLLVSALGACELQEVTVVEVEDVVVVEAYALVGVQGPVSGAPNRLFAFLGRTVGTGEDPALAGAEVEVTGQDGTRFTLGRVPLENCVSDEERARPGACFDAGVAAAGLRPGDLLELEARLPDGRVLRGSTTIPGDFEIVGEVAECTAPADTPFEVRWSAAEGARAYVNETRIDGLDRALASEGIDAPSELYLVGLSISASDTTIVFPGEFGVFDRFDLDQALSVRLQSGLPGGTEAVVGITAVDRNSVDWARGGNFNPSGQIRVPSVHGDGTGVFASGVMRRFRVAIEDEPTAGLVPCPGLP